MREHVFTMSGDGLLEQSAELSGNISDSIGSELCFDELNEFVDLIVRKIYSENAFNCLDGIFLEFGTEVFICLDLFQNLFCFCFNIHENSPLNHIVALWLEKSISWEKEGNNPLKKAENPRREALLACLTDCKAKQYNHTVKYYF